VTPGRIIYLLWYRPLATLARSRREGGPINQWRNEQGRRAMVAAAAKLHPSSIAAGSAPEVWFLTGRKYWYQTAFCLYSLQKVSANAIRPVFVDDGTFDHQLRTECMRVFSNARIVDSNEINQTLDQSLPASRFPSLRAQRLTYPHLRKLTDIHAGRHGWRLVFDSDMLFFRSPDILWNWLRMPDRPVHMQDIQDAYGYPGETLSTLAGRPIHSRINVGVCGLRSDAIDWERLEYWCTQLLAKHGTSYYLEQALVALLIAGHDTIRLDQNEYRVMPDSEECRRPTAILHHYVDLSKRGYFRHAWKHSIPA